MRRSLALSALALVSIISITFLTAGSDQDLDPDDAKMVRSIFEEVLVNGETYPLLDHLANKIGPRLSGSEGAARAILWTRQVMEEYGFDRVFLQEVMVPHWERGEKEVCKIVASTGGDDLDLSVLALGGSVATPADGLTAEVIAVESLDEVAELGREKIAGKIVFYNRPFDQRSVNTGAAYGGAVDQRLRGASRAAEYGAVGVVIRSVTSSFDDTPHTGTLVYQEGIAKIPAAALGVVSANKLAERLQADASARLHLHMTCRWLPDAKSYNVVGEFTGSEYPEQFILVGGHLDSWDVGQGAHDDGAGSMQSIAALRTLQKLNYKPRHTLRTVLFMNEENGTGGGRKYAELAERNQENHVIAIESDAGGFVPRGFGVTAGETIIAKMRSWLPHFDRDTISYISKGGGGVDIRPLNSSLGVPIVGLITDSQRAFHVHHSVNDVFTAVDRRELELGTGALAALIYLVDKNGLQ